MSSANVSAVSTYKFDFGDYSGLAFYGGIFYPCWGDNSNSFGDNPEGTLHTLDVYTSAVIVAPQLNLTRTQTNSLLAWPNPSTGFLLQESPGLNPASWTNSASVPVIVDGQKRISLALANDTWFYRLTHPPITPFAL